MRTLLVASQKSGSGKTTTSINLAAAAAQAGQRVLLFDADPMGAVSHALRLAEHGQRIPLRQAGLDCDGTLFRDVMPGLDVISPFLDGLTNDANLERLLALLESTPLQVQYHSTILDAPPFMGLRPRDLFRRADEYILVMRAEAQSLRMLPLCLETLKTIQREDAPLVLRGVLLTQPEDSKCERDLRRYLGDKALPPTIPADEQVAKAGEAGRAVALIDAEAPAALEYGQLAGLLGLVAGATQYPLPRMGARPTLESISVPPVESVPPIPVEAEAPLPQHLVAQAPPRRPTSLRNDDPLVSKLREEMPSLRKNGAGRSGRRDRQSTAHWPWWVGGATGVGALGGMVRTPELFFPMAVGLATAAGLVAVLRLALTYDDRPLPVYRTQRRRTPR